SQRPTCRTTHPTREPLEESWCAGLHGFKQLAAGRGVAQKLPKGLLIGERVEQILIGQRGGVQEFALLLCQSAGGESAQKISDVLILHRRPPNCRPSDPEAACGSARPTCRSC